MLQTSFQHTQHSCGNCFSQGACSTSFLFFVYLLIAHIVPHPQPRSLALSRKQLPAADPGAGSPRGTLGDALLQVCVRVCCLSLCAG